MNLYFRSHLMHWNRLENDRQMPWKGEKDPYRIWLSEIILQQTRVEQGISYYERFVTEFPSIRHLAVAPEAKVFKLWEGLGYYSRCRNLIITAKHIANELNGLFPTDLEGLRSLKGVGPYTAAAIASFAYDLPHAVVDGNVFRVLARFFGLSIPIDTKEGKAEFSKLAQQLLDKKAPALYNQAIMDLGAVICKPRSPNCNACPLLGRCRAFRDGNFEELPVKSPKPSRRKRYLYYVFAEKAGKVLIRERTGRDVWRHLHEFFLIEKKNPVKLNSIWQEIKRSGFPVPAIPVTQSFHGPYRQMLTHQEINALFIKIILRSNMPAPEGYAWRSKENLKDFAFPRLTRSFLSETEE